MKLGCTAVVLAAHVLACVPGMPASSPEAFQIAAGTPVTLHMRHGKNIEGELAGDDARTVSLDSGRIVVAKADIDTVETHGDYAVKRQQAMDEYGRPSAGTMVQRTSPVEYVVRAIVVNIPLFLPH